MGSLRVETAVIDLLVSVGSLHRVEWILETVHLGVHLEIS